MQTSHSVRPIEKQIVLIGAGNAHLVFVKMWGMRPLPGVAVTLINSSAVVPYSAMVSGFLAGEYQWDDITVDLVRLCQSHKVRFLAGFVEKIDRDQRQVIIKNRPSLSYDVVSIGLGSIPRIPEPDSASNLSFALRPLTPLVRMLEQLDNDLSESSADFHMAVVGGGASGCELALSVHKRLSRFQRFRLSVYQNAERLVPHLAPRVAAYFHQAFADRGIVTHLGTKVTGISGGKLLTQKKQASGQFSRELEQTPIQAVIWATEGIGHSLIRNSGLKVNERGFLEGLPTLQSVSNPEVFGNGDCISFSVYPTLPKNGVHAVRQGQVLFQNIRAFLQEKPLKPFRPQRVCLVLLNQSDGQAIMNYGPITTRGRGMRWLKNKIDQVWMRKLTQFPAMNGSEKTDKFNPLMRCGGCGSKISQNVLSAVLRRLPLKSDPRILVGCQDGEDAAVHKVIPRLYGELPEDLVEVQTVDYFKAMVDDPYLFGRIAALHALSDLYAMNARPFSALAIATLPLARGPIQESMLFELLSGAVDAFHQLGVVLTGGHTTEGTDLALGFAVTGFGEANRLFQKKALEVGDQLILTKPLGSGVLLAGLMRGESRAQWVDELIRALLLDNSEPSKIFNSGGVRACTDVTGFGLVGHLLEMLDASGVSAKIYSSAVPVLPGFHELASRGILSSLHDDNVRGACRVDGLTPPPVWLFDPQTSGGLLGAVKPNRVEDTLRQLNQAGYVDARVIGEVTQQGAIKQSRILVI